MRWACWLFLAGALARCLAAGAELAPIADAANDPSWREVISRLGPGKARLSAFEERRYFPFHRDPIVLKGEIRLDPVHGLSLHYLTPEARVIVADAKGLLMRDASGRESSLPDDSRAQAATAALARVLRFDLAGFEKSFSLRGRRDGDAWTLSFEARDPGLAPSVGTLVLSGDRSRLRRIEMTRPRGQRIEIIIGETREGVVFTRDEIARFFR